MKFRIIVEYVGGRKPWKSTAFEWRKGGDAEGWYTCGSIYSYISGDLDSFSDQDEFVFRAKTPEWAWYKAKEAIDRVIRLHEMKKHVLRTEDYVFESDIEV